MPPDPISPYGVAKLAAERYCVAFSRVYEIVRDRRAALLQRLRPAPEPVLAVRRRDPALHHRDRARASRSRSTATASSRATSRTSTNVVDATIRAAEAPGASGRIFNVAAGAPATRQPTSPTRSARSSASRSRRRSRRRAPGDIRDSWADVTAAREVLGYEPTVDLEEGLAAPSRRSCLSADSRPARDRAPEHGRPGAARRVPDEGPRRRAATTRRSSPARSRAARTRCRSSRRSSASTSSRCRELHREISPIYDPVAIARLVRVIRRVRPHILHTHTAKAGAVGRVAALLAGDARPPIVVHTFHGHVLRGYFDPLTHAVLPGDRARARAPHDAPDRGRPRGARRPRRARRRARRRSSRVIRLGIDLDARVLERRDGARASCAGCSASRTTASSSAGSAA